MGASQSVLWIALGVALMRVVPSFEKVFKDFGTELPALTVAVLYFGHFLVSYWYLGLLLVLLWSFLNSGIVVLLSPNPFLQRLWRIATWTLPFVCAAIVAVAFFRPLVVLIDKTSS
jgi:type II secretory pathway component PulF